MDHFYHKVYPMLLSHTISHMLHIKAALATELKKVNNCWLKKVFSVRQSDFYRQTINQTVSCVNCDMILSVVYMLNVLIYLYIFPLLVVRMLLWQMRSLSG